MLPTAARTFVLVETIDRDRIWTGSPGYETERENGGRLAVAHTMVANIRSKSKLAPMPIAWSWEECLAYCVWPFQ